MNTNTATVGYKEIEEILINAGITKSKSFSIGRTAGYFEGFRSEPSREGVAKVWFTPASNTLGYDVEPAFLARRKEAHKAIIAALTAQGFTVSTPRAKSTTWFSAIELIINN